MILLGACQLWLDASINSTIIHCRKPVVRSYCSKNLLSIKYFYDDCRILLRNSNMIVELTDASDQTFFLVFSVVLIKAKDTCGRSIREV